MSIRPRQVEMFVASRIAESLGGKDQLLEIILERRNMFRALNQFRANKGAGGVDGMRTNQLGGYLKRHWAKIKMDLSKFFDRVNHDRLMSRLATRIRDKRVLKLIRRYLNAGTMIDGLVSHADEGTPQGGPLSPLLSNIVLDELDKELEARGRKFVRYADDFMIYCKSRKAAERVEKSITRFITVRLKLKVNEEKSAVSRPWLRKFLGLTFISMCGQTKIRIHQKSIERFKARIRELTSRNGGKSLYQIIESLNQYLRGWWNYYRLTEARHIFKSLNGWIIRRLRCIVWKQWKNPRTKVRNLKKLGIGHKHAVSCGNARKKHWRMSRVKWVIIALPNRYFYDRRVFLPGN